jgi:cysteine protease ATG4
VLTEGKLSPRTGWRRGTEAEQEKKLLSLFADDPRAPYSIHKFVDHGAVACGKYPGEWFGPSATARCIQYVQRRPQSGIQCVFLIAMR